MTGGDFERIPDAGLGIAGDRLAVGLLLIAQTGLGMLTLLAAILTQVVTAPCGTSVPCGGDGWFNAAILIGIGGSVFLLACGLILAVLRIRQGRHGWPAALTTVGLQFLLLFLVFLIGIESGPV